ncbi:MAG TPA: alpha/beta hydrolase [Acidimicrobiales bacterium]|nr:alpha/beta hydrolase [Acidimicrobiales bacterium]
MNRNDWRAELARARRFAQRLETTDPAAPVPPPGLPPGRVVELPGRGEVFVRERPGRPDQPTILLLHGWTASADLNWFRAYDAVGAEGRLLALDHRGHGRGLRSEARFSLADAADDAAALLRTLDAGPAVVVGYSMGGPIAMLLWERHPDVVSGLVLEATALEWRATRRERFVFKFMAGLEFVLRSGRPRGLLDRTLRDAVHESPDLAPLLGWLKAELRRGDPAAIADAGRALGDHDARPFAGRIDVPTAVVVTTKDRLVRPRKQRELARAVPGARTFEIEADHDCCLVKPGPFARQTVAAIRDVVGRQTPRRREGLEESSTGTRVAGWGV